MCSSADILEGKSPARLYDCVHGLMQVEGGGALRRGSTGLTPQRHTSATPPKSRDFSAV